VLFLHLKFVICAPEIVKIAAPQDFICELRIKFINF